MLVLTLTRQCAYMCRMSDMEYDRIPPLTLGLRLKMVMDWRGHSRDAMATEMGVSPSTISRWTNEPDPPLTRGMISAWATFTHSDFHWLLTGEQPADGGPVELGDDEVRQQPWDGDERRRDGPNRQRPHLLFDDGVTTH